MRERVSEITESIKRIGQIQVFDWDLKTVLNTEISELELTHSLRRLGQIQVFDWDFATVVPTIKKTANTEIDLKNFLKRTAQIQVFEWDFRTVLPAKDKAEPTALLIPRRPAAPTVVRISPAEMHSITLRLKNFLQYVAVNLIDEPNHAQIKVTELGPNRLRFKLVLVKRDVSMLIGKNGFTASAIRSILKATAEMNGIQALLQIHSHEDEIALLAKEDGLLGPSAR